MSPQSFFSRADFEPYTSRPTFISAGMLSTRSFTTRSASCILTCPFILPAMLPEASSTIITLAWSARAAGALQSVARASPRAAIPVPGLFIETDLRL